MNALPTIEEICATAQREMEPALAEEIPPDGGPPISAEHLVLYFSAVIHECYHALGIPFEAPAGERSLMGDLEKIRELAAKQDAGV